MKNNLDRNLCINELKPVYEKDNFDKLIIALKDIIIEWKGNKAEDIANEIENRISCYIMSDRESLPKDQSGVRDNIFEIQNVLNALYEK